VGKEKGDVEEGRITGKLETRLSLDEERRTNKNYDGLEKENVRAYFKCRGDQTIDPNKDLHPFKGGETKKKKKKKKKQQKKKKQPKKKKKKKKEKMEIVKLQSRGKEARFNRGGTEEKGIRFGRRRKGRHKKNPNP